MENQVYVIKSKEETGKILYALSSVKKLAENIEHHNICNLEIDRVTNLTDHSADENQDILENIKEACSQFMDDVENMEIESFVDCFIN
jgi:hypothetical protein